MSLILLDTKVCDGVNEFIDWFNLETIFTKVYGTPPQKFNIGGIKEFEIIESLIQELEKRQIIPYFIELIYYKIGANKFGLCLYGNHFLKDINSLVSVWNFDRVRKSIIEETFKTSSFIETD